MENRGFPLSAEVLEKLPNPCYVMDKALLARNLREIARVRDEAGVEIILALKGFAMWSAFGFLREAGFNRVTASSYNEAKLGFEQMGTPAYTYAPIYTEEEIGEIARLSSHLTFNSLSQYRRFAGAARGANREISLGLRVNPEISSVGTDLYNPCVPGSRLGVRLQELPAPETLGAGSDVPGGERPGFDVASDFPGGERPGFDVASDVPGGERAGSIEGFHCHALCESDAQSSCNLIDRFEERFAAYLPYLKWVNFGGGHLLTRRGYDTRKLIERLKAFRAEHPHLQVILEPGAAFVWETGYLLARVEDIVNTRPEIAAGTPPVALMNVSFTAHMPDCLEMPYMPRVFGAVYEGQEENPDPKYRYRYRLGGNSCLAGDYMGDWLFEKPLEAGSLLLFNDMIHYTFVKTTMFNGVRHPSLCIVDKDEVIFRRDFGYADFKSRLS